jgi:8-oxo-dGTP pyrophosphatase MutT (NUDIX family)
MQPRCRIRLLDHNRSMVPADPANETDLTPAPDPPIRDRLAGRVLLLDPANRVLLMRYDNSPPNGRHWSTPGGGLEPGEDYAAAAARELAEETGWTDIEVGAELHRRDLIMGYSDETVRQHERFFLARTSPVGREIRGVDAMHKSDGIAAWRWWSLAELESTSEVVWPAELPALIRAALGGGGSQG